MTWWIWLSVAVYFVGCFFGLLCALKAGKRADESWEKLMNEERRAA